MISKHWVLFVLILASCSTHQKIAEIPDVGMDAPPGIPFRVLTPYTIRVFTKGKDGNFQQVYVQSQDLPDQDCLFALNVSSDFFSNHVLQVNVNNDSTLNGSSVTTAITIAPAVAALGTQTTAVGDTIANFNNNRRTQELANLQSESSLRLQRLTSQTNLVQQRLTLEQTIANLQKQNQAPQLAREAALVAALQSLNAARAAQQLVDNPPKGTTPVQQANNEGSLRLAELQANQASEAAGLQDPYPGVFP